VIRIKPLFIIVKMNKELTKAINVLDKIIQSLCIDITIYKNNFACMEIMDKQSIHMLKLHIQAYSHTIIYLILDYFTYPTNCNHNIFTDSSSAIILGIMLRIPARILKRFSIDKEWINDIFSIYESKQIIDIVNICKNIDYTFNPLLTDYLRTYFSKELIIYNSPLINNDELIKEMKVLNIINSTAYSL